MRASDSDRERTVTLLTSHAAAGRLSETELEERVAAALSSRTEEELALVLRDLPTAPPPKPGRRVPRLGGEWRAYAAVMTLLVAIWALTGAGYFWPVWPALGWGAGLLMPGSCASSHRTARHFRRPA